MTDDELRDAIARRTADARSACEESMRLTGTVDRTERSVAETHGPGLMALLTSPLAEPLFAVVAAGGEFAPSDFEFASVPSHRITDVKLQRYVQKLKANTQDERSTAAALLNVALAPVAGVSDPGYSPKPEVAAAPAMPWSLLRIGCAWLRATDPFTAFRTPGASAWPPP